MGYTIFELPQVTPRFRTVHGANGPEQVETALPAISIPAGCSVLFQPASLDRFSADPALRCLLLADPQGTATLDQVIAAFPDVLKSKFAKLWQAAHDYEQRYISGVGLSILSLGVAQNRPKCLAVADWSNRLWMDYYYPRKASVTPASEPDCDFSPAGEMPYSVPELAAEVYGS